MGLPVGDRFVLTPTQEIASHHLFDMVDWELHNFPEKWVHELVLFFQGGISHQRGMDLVRQYTRQSTQIQSAELAVDRVAANPNMSTSSLSRAIGASVARLEQLRSQHDAIRNDVEQFLESQISTTIRSQGLGLPLGAEWPPVDFRLQPPPQILVTSSRDEIKLKSVVLLDPGLPLTEAIRLENQVEKREGLSAVVLPLGGLSTYPSFVEDDLQLRDTLNVAAHEWVHGYLFFHPLGQHYDANGNMQTLNETVADTVGKALGGLTWSRMTGQPLPKPQTTTSPPAPPPPAFDFDRFMHDTRLHTDSLLANGKVKDAEQYMDARRAELYAHGYLIRKLNQAYFAFHGTYADTAASVNPIGPEVSELRQRIPNLGAFLKVVAGVGTIEQFDSLLKRYGIPVSRSGSSS